MVLHAAAYREELDLPDLSDEDKDRTLLAQRKPAAGGQSQVLMPIPVSQPSWLARSSRA